jgi:multidrug resistance efflux pump
MWKPSRIIRPTITLTVAIVAASAAYRLWNHYMYAPWTRDGRILADIIMVAPDVSGQVVEVAVADNQEVKAGDLLFKVDPDRYRIAVDRARAALAAARAAQENARASLEMARINRGLKQSEAQRRGLVDETVVTRENRESADASARTAASAVGAATAMLASEAAHVQESEAALAAVKLDLQRTQVLAPADGYVTNLSIHRGNYAVNGKPVVAIVDRRSFHVEGFFEETKLPGIRPGAPAEVRLMSGGSVLHGHLAGLARAIADPDTEGLLSNVNPTYHWVRLANRIPVRVELDDPRDKAGLSAGMTCTVTVATNLPFSRHPLCR